MTGGKKKDGFIKRMNPLAGWTLSWRAWLGGLLVVLACGLPAGAGWAWGPDGHRIAAQIAQHRLHGSVQRYIQGEFNIKRLAAIANWADWIKSKRPATRPWHYTNLPAGETVFDPRRDCPTGDCVTAKIPHFAAILADRDAPSGARREALMFLVHFVADVHQPMHLGNPGDRGGNRIAVQWQGKETNLHAVWDHHLISRRPQSLVQYAAALNRAVSPGQALAWREGDVLQWTLESRTLALRDAYPLTFDGRGELSPRYLEQGRQVVERRLTQAGVRLADLLNRLLKTERVIER